MRRDHLMPALSAAGFKCFRPRGAYYVMTDISAFGFKDDVSFAKYLVQDIGVARCPDQASIVIPGTAQISPFRLLQEARDARRSLAQASI